MSTTELHPCFEHYMPPPKNLRSVFCILSSVSHNNHNQDTETGDAVHLVGF